MVGVVAQSDGRFGRLRPRFVRGRALARLVAGGAVLFGAVAGFWGARQAWLAGIIVGIPFTVAQITRWSALERAVGTPDYWILVPLVAVPATGMAIVGALTGAWVRNTR
ncbi:MAG: hypothetical protein IPN65_09530 [Elusimicrobia bacterium]|nr:hypothetical protein [Elusimicrobiota bacterium]